MQWALDKIQAWVAEAGLELSPTKSVAVLFIKGKLAKINFPGKLPVNSKEIEYSHEASYLGVQLDRKLNFRAHIDLKIKKSRQHIMRLRSSMGKLWGPNPYLTRWAYLCAVRQALTLGHFVWAWKATTSTIKRKSAGNGAQDVRPLPPLDAEGRDGDDPQRPADRPLPGV